MNSSNRTSGEHDLFDDSSFAGKFQNCTFVEASTSEYNKSKNDSLNTSALNVSALCCDEEISGYDKLSGRTWIYPTNYPVRDYQFNIIKAAIVKNTLVSLPTGLGKTFIAAVIMYNFYRWYPLGKIVFMAPTRPLVAQQIDACYNIIAIPPDDSIEMTGHMQANTRKLNWQTKRVIFATPQVIYNDIKSGICPSEHIRCLVFDEAHRARGNYAYCLIVGSLTDMGHKTFRILALSATPGSKVEDVVNVVKSLHIAHLELRTEYCIDVAPYSHSKSINTVIIQLGPELTHLREQYVEILDGYARKLKQLNILPHNLGNMSKGRIVMLYKEYQNKERGARHPQHNYIMKDFTNLIGLYHGLELLVKHGTRVFLNFFDEHPEKAWIQNDDRLTALLERLRDDMGVNPLALDRSLLPDGTIPEVPKDLRFGHPKFDKLREIMMEHFEKSKKKGQDTRAIVFCEYRESVNLVHCLLLQCRPLIRPQMFVGQGASGKAAISQKQQLRAMRSFREGGCNVLVATCVAEEGLDVGQVDLILCFDISTRSPIRLVQRCGRTGRERGGQVHILVTEGREHQTLLDCIRQRDGLNKKVLHSNEVQNNLYKINPRMIPHDFMPECQKMYITVAKKSDANDKQKEAKTGQKDLRNMLLKRSSTCGSSSSSREFDANSFITKLEFDDMFVNGYEFKPYFDDAKEYFSMSRDSFTKCCDPETPKSKLISWLDWQRNLQKTVNIGHTRESEILSELLASADRKKFEMLPPTQNPTFNTQEIIPPVLPQVIEIKATQSPAKVVTRKKTKPAAIVKATTNKDGDIRALFSTATKSTKNYTKLINDLGIQNDGTLPTALIDLLVDLTLENTSAARKCYVCSYVCECSIFSTEEIKKKTHSFTFLDNLILPDIKLIDDIESKTLRNYNTVTEHHSVVLADKSKFNFDLDFDFDCEEIMEANEVNETDEADRNFDLGHIEDIFVESSPEEANNVNNKQLQEEKDTEAPKEALDFFGLDSIEDIFADSDCDSNPSKVEKQQIENHLANAADKTHLDNNEPDDCTILTKKSQEVKPIVQRAASPSILSGSVLAAPSSPILCSQSQRHSMNMKSSQIKCSTPLNINSKRTLFKNATLTKQANLIETDRKSHRISDVANQSKDKSMFTITQLVEMINETDKNASTSVHSLSIPKNNAVQPNEIHVDKERSMSPILLTQSEIAKAKPSVSNIHSFRENMNKIESSDKEKSKLMKRPNASLIILDSDSDSNASTDTIAYDIELLDKNCDIQKSPLIEIKSPINTKRKHDDNDISASPYFNKKLKLSQNNRTHLSLQEKVIAALNFNKVKDALNEKRTDFFNISPVKVSQKENLQPLQCDSLINNFSKDKNEINADSPIEKLKMFKRIKLSRTKPNHKIINRNNYENSKEDDINDLDSDDDFVGHRNIDNNMLDSSSTINHKIRKKKKSRKPNAFIELEAELSDASCDSGDEMSDGSVGSIVDFICDENVRDKDDMYAHYVKSIKSPAKGVFKIPQLPGNFVREEIFSQYVNDQDDSYEMDSFCVDSHIGFTQVADVTELELAEQKLEMRRKAKRKRCQPTLPQGDAQNKGNVSGVDSPVAKPSRVAKRRISSDSDD